MIKGEGDLCMESGCKNASVQLPLFMEPLPFPFVIPSEAEGSAVPRTLPESVFLDAQRIA
jgi:hypothetical protein